MEFQAAFCPVLAQQYNIDLVLRTSTNDKYVIKVKGEAVEAPISFSSSVLVMRTTGPGERVLESTMVTNTTNKQQCLEICTPHPKFSWVKVSPTILDLPAGESRRVEVEFVPPQDLIGLDPKEWYSHVLDSLKPPSSGEGASGASQLSDGAEQTPPSLSPLREWKEEDGWVFASGLYGDIQWTKEGAGTQSKGAQLSGPAGDVQGEA